MLFGECFLYNVCFFIFMGLTIMNGKAQTVNRGAIYWETIFVDHSGHRHFTKIQSAIDSVPLGNKKWVRIYVSAGVYREQVQVPLEKQFIYLVGAGKWNTSIVWDASESLDTSATFSVYADNFVAQDITFVNSYNYPWNPRFPRKQAAAARVQGDKNSFYNCGFIGLQDTLWDVQGRHYFYSSSIIGAVDFICGAGQSIYERCTLLSNGTTLEGPGYITAQARGDAKESSGFVFKDCVVIGTGWTYLGRAWGDYARVIFYRSTFYNIIVAAGWDSWHFAGHENRLTFAENLCGGLGSNKRGRVKWESQLNQEQLQQLTSISFIDNEGWIGRQPFNMLAY